MQRPTGILVTSALMAMVPLIGVVDAFTRPLPPSMRVYDFVLTTETGVGVFVIAIIQAFVLVAYFNGQEWARVLVLVVSGLYLPEAFWVAALWRTDPEEAILTAAKAATGIFLLVYLSTRAIRTWFAEQTKRNKAPA